MSDKKKVEHPEWHAPKGLDTGIKVRNSLTSTNVPFVVENNLVKWYACGPTVYDSAHLGHARAYVTFDIIRRIMEDYFNLNVHYVMNITDIDDKIILRARRNHLLAQYLKDATRDQLVKDGMAGFDFGLEKMAKGLSILEEELKTVKPKFREDAEKAVGEHKLKMSNMTSEKEKFAAIAGDAASTLEHLSTAGGAALSQHLDSQKGATVTDQKIFAAHATHFENEFLEDMRALGVRDAHVLTRVSEYVQPIIEFIQKIIANGFGYESNGSVYFNVSAFKESHNYGKLAPWSVENVALINEGEGSLKTEAGDKTSQFDFVLWKKSKPGEPRWESPWGLGRPGWHIECSSMATDILGTNFHVHSGGEDLKFPHHDNELAQSEAFSGNQQWVDYFMHAGHLHIKGFKMSKSLKNFITIRAVLSRNSARQIRLLFLLQPWDGKMNYSEGSLTEAIAKEKLFKEFFLSVKSAILRRGGQAVPEKWTESERVLSEFFEQCQEKVHKNLQDNFNYSGATNSLLEMVNATNKYLVETQDSYKVPLLKRVIAYVDRMLRVFGVIPDADWGFSSGQGGASTEQAIKKFVDAFAVFRDNIREASFQKKSLSDILKLCDQVRDTTLPQLGIRLEDVKDCPSIWKFDNPEELMKEMEAKKAAAAANKRKKLQGKLDNRVKEVEKWRKASAPADSILKAEDFRALYSQWGEQGYPTHDKDGKELAKSQLKAIKKKVSQQQKANQKYNKALEKDSNLMKKLETEIETFKAELAAL